MNPLVPLVVLPLVGLVAFVVYRQIMVERARKAEEASRATALGFRALTQPDSEAVDRILALHRRYDGQQLEVRELFCKEEGAHRLYLFDLADTTGDDSGVTHVRAVAAISPRLQVPRVSLVPRIDLEGKVAAAANWLLEKFVSRPGHEVDFPSAPEFERRYNLIVDDEDAARRFFTVDRLARLAKTRHWIIEAGGDSLTFDQLEMDPRRKGAPADLPGRLRDALSAVEIFAGPPG